MELGRRSRRPSVVDTTTTAVGGTYAFSMSDQGTYTVRQQTQPNGYLDGRASNAQSGRAADNTTDSDAVTGIVIGAPGTQLDPSDYDFAELLPASLQGLAWEDFDADGEVGLGRDRRSTGVAITLTGTDDRGTAVNLMQNTDGQGIYEFVDLRPGVYMVKETQPTELGGVPTDFIDGDECLANCSWLHQA